MVGLWRDASLGKKEIMFEKEKLGNLGKKGNQKFAPKKRDGR